MPFNVSVGVRKLKLLKSEKYITIPALTTPPCPKCSLQDKPSTCDCKGCKGLLSDVETAKKHASYRWKMQPCFCNKTSTGNTRVVLNYSVYPPYSDKTFCWDPAVPISSSCLDFEVLKGTSVSCTCTRRINSLFNYVFFITPQREIGMLRLCALGPQTYYRQIAGVLPANVDISSYAARYVSANFNDRKKAYVQFSPSADRGNMTRHAATNKAGRKKYGLFFRKAGEEEGLVLPGLREMSYAFLLMGREWNKKLDMVQLGRAYEVQIKFLNFMKDLEVQEGKFDAEHGNSEYGMGVKATMAKLLAVLAFYPHTLHPHRLLTELLPPIPSASAFWMQIHQHAPPLFHQSKSKLLNLLSTRMSDLESFLPGGANHPTTKHPLLDVKKVGEKLDMEEDGSTLNEKSETWSVKSDAETLMSLEEFREWCSLKDVVPGNRDSVGWEMGGAGVRMLGLVGWPKYWYLGKRDCQKAGTTFWT